jgi:hypothetical protein
MAKSQVWVNKVSKIGYGRTTTALTTPRKEIRSKKAVSTLRLLYINIIPKLCPSYGTRDQVFTPIHKVVKKTR